MGNNKHPQQQSCNSPLPSPPSPLTPILLKLSESSETPRLRPGSLPKPCVPPPIPLPSLPRKKLVPTLSEVPTSLLLHLVELTRPPLLKHSSLLIKPLLVPPLPLNTLKRWPHSELLPLMSPTLLLALTKMPS